MGFTEATQAEMERCLDNGQFNREAFWLRQEPKESLCVSVTKCSLFIFLAQISKQSVRNHLAVSQSGVSSQVAEFKQSSSRLQADFKKTLRRL